MRSRAIALLLFLASPSLVSADALADLRAKLKSLTPQGEIRARIDVQSRSESSENDNVDTSTESVLGELGPQGLRIGWMVDQLAAARAAEMQSHRNPDAPQTGVVLGEIPASTLANLLDHAWGLLLTLEGGTLVDQKPDNSKGVCGLLLVVRPLNRMSAADAKIIKSYEDVLKIWLDAEGWPVGSDRQIKYRGSKFFVSFSGEQRQQREYARANGHLIIAHETRQGSGSGLGTESHGTTTTTVTLMP